MIVKRGFMHKLVILIENLGDWESFESRWPQFLHLAEKMPGLRREATSRVERFLFGKTTYSQVHELFFDSLSQTEAALTSPQGREAGRLLQQMTGGRMALFIAEYKEDDINNIRKYTQGEKTD